MGEVAPGVYTHHKGAKYRVLFVALDATNARNGAAIVVYESFDDGKKYTRDLSEFTELVEWPDGAKRPRFAPDSPAS